MSHSDQPLLRRSCNPKNHERYEKRNDQGDNAKYPSHLTPSPVERAARNAPLNGEGEPKEADREEANGKDTVP